jgi:hypothetical protein
MDIGPEIEVITVEPIEEPRPEPELEPEPEQAPLEEPGEPTLVPAQNLLNSSAPGFEQVSRKGRSKAVCERHRTA